MEESTANVLIVDDVEYNLVILEEMVKSLGYEARPIDSAKRALAAIHQKLPQLILLDISMPDMDGYEFCEFLKKDVRTREIPIIFISAMDTMEDKKKGFDLGAVDFITKPFELEEVTARVTTHLKIYQMKQEQAETNRRLHKMVNDQIRRIQEEEKNFILALAKLLELQGNTSSIHLRNVAKNCRLLSMSLQFTPKFEKEVSNSFVETIEFAALLHDIGEIGISDRILSKPGALTPEEMEIVKTHSKRGADILQELLEMNSHNECLKMAVDIARYHHERWDGSGYPEGLRGEEIPLVARIAAIVDVYSALVEERCYRPPYSHEESIRIINEGAGTLFDADIIEVFNKVQNQLQKG